MTNRKTRWTLTTLALLLSLPTPRASAQASADPTLVEVRGGTVNFHVTTNVSAISVHGHSNSLEATVRIHHGPEGTVLENVEASVPEKSLATGMSLRDEHMRKQIFTAPDGQRPDVRFVAARTTCSASGSGRPKICELTGELTIRGIERPFRIALKVSDESKAFRVVGEAIVKLSAYGIEQPSQLGVRTADDVRLQMEFTARQVAQLVTARSEGVR